MRIQHLLLQCPLETQQRFQGPAPVSSPCLIQHPSRSNTQNIPRQLMQAWFGNSSINKSSKGMRLTAARHLTCPAGQHFQVGNKDIPVSLVRYFQPKQPVVRPVVCFHV